MVFGSWSRSWRRHRCTFLDLHLGLSVGLGQDSVLNILSGCFHDMLLQLSTLLDLVRTIKPCAIKFSKLTTYILSRKFLLNKTVDVS